MVASGACLGYYTLSIAAMKKEGTGEQQKGREWARFPGYFHDARNPRNLN